MKEFTPADKDFVYPEQPLTAAEVVTALNEGRLEVYVEYQRQLYERADDDPSPRSRTLVLVELAKVSHAARDKLMEFHSRIPLWKRHLDAAYLDAYMRQDFELLDGICELMESYGGVIPTGEDLRLLMSEEGR